MRRTLIALAATGLLGLTVATPPAHAQGVTWQAWDAGFRTASRKSQPVLVDVYTDWCGWCKRMDKDVYSRADVRDYLSSHFVTIKLNAEDQAAATHEGRRYTSRTLAAKFGVTGYPTTVFLRPNGERLVNVPGYLPADRFLLLLRYIGDGHMDRGVAWDDYMAKAQGSAR